MLIEHVSHLPVVDFLGCPDLPDSTVVDHNVDGTEALHGAGDEVGRRCGVAHIVANRQQRVGVGGEQIGDPLGSSHRGHHAVPCGQRRFGESPSDARGCAGDDPVLCHGGDARSSSALERKPLSEHRLVRGRR